jgi:anti-sigma factor ChrR (cupin superfamily)
MKRAVDLIHAFDLTWQPVPSVPGAYFIPLNEDLTTGACTWLIKQEPGCIFPEHSHPSWTEMMVLRGEMYGPEGAFRAGSYQSCAPHVRHGPYRIGSKDMIGLLVSSGPIW